jgi:peptidoglycan/LPS O-acetylase OafA/YrhL
MSTNYDARPDTTNGQNLHYQFIDYLKVLAFSTVVIAHQFSAERDTLFATSVFNVRLFHPIEVFLTNGGGGVSLFFIISGYLIAKSMQRETPIQFLVRRTLRIFPLYWLAIVAYLVRYRTRIGYSDSIGVFTLMGDFWNSSNILEGVDWTLRIEILFYIFGLLFLALAQTFLNARRLYPLYITSLLVAAFLIPKYPTGWASAYPSIFIPLFALGIVCAIHETKKRLMLTSAGIIIPLLVSVINVKRYRPDLIDGCSFFSCRMVV